MAKISPSILAGDFVNLERSVNEIAASGAEWVHVDVMDGTFVPNITIGMPVVRALRRITDLTLDVHLMVDRPIRFVEDFCKAGVDLLTIHVEADTVENTLAALDKIASFGCKPAVSIKPETPAEAVVPFLEKCGMVLVMTVEPGFGGQRFRYDMMPKLRALRELRDRRNPGCLLQVDGGVDLITAPVCKENGADILVTGSAFFRAADRISFVKAIQA